MTVLGTHLLLTLPIVAAVVGGIWLWGRLERWCEKALAPEPGGEEPFPGAWPFGDEAGTEGPAKLTREKGTSDSQ